ncbi:MAG TPA: COX15/CtaA family protein [Caldimonas sp.]|jgi:cytochrome c oxidase assembly protein subunit 15|nr:COX15/CtaA family protein [Caldimonas sp.]HEX2540836.1 COX15/CtaA family protein [Caldimonas sp.]
MTSDIVLSPVLGVVGIGLVIALLPLLWFWRRHRHNGPRPRLRALALLTLFLSFDLVLLGAFTRLSDSGLGCPDWPGCYGHASPIGASEHIARAEAEVPTGAVTQGKAWIEMAHRYSATAIGLLIATLAVMAWRAARRDPGLSAGAAIVTLIWVCVQGAFGALTVTMKLYPAIVTLHLLGGLALLALLALQAEGYAPRRLAVSPGVRAGLVGVAVLTVLQVTLGGWVSTNYAVLACQDFPTCQGTWWPAMDFEQGFAWRRPLGGAVDGGYLPFQALTAIHVAHRLGAAVLLPALALLAWKLHVRGGSHRAWGHVLAGIGAWQVASGLSNVLLGWPLVAAVAHTAGSAALVVTLAILLVRTRPSGAPAGEPWRAPVRPLAS